MKHNNISKLTILSYLFIGTIANAQNFYTCLPKEDYIKNLARQIQRSDDEVRNLARQVKWTKAEIINIIREYKKEYNTCVNERTSCQNRNNQLSIDGDKVGIAACIVLPVPGCIAAAKTAYIESQGGYGTCRNCPEPL